MEKNDTLGSTSTPKLVYREERGEFGGVGKGHHLDKKREGEWIWYYKSGRPCMKETYRNGVLHGPYETYDYPGGEIFSKGHYNNGKREGVNEYWKGQKEGGYYWMRQEFKEDQFHGPWEEYNKHGELRRLLLFKEGIEIKSFSKEELKAHNEEIKEKGIATWRARISKLI